MKSLLKIALLLVACSTLSVAVAQEPVREETQGKTFSDKLPSIKFYGFVRTYFIYDNRSNFNSMLGLTNKEPKDEVLNNFGEDENATSSSGLFALSTRFGINLDGPEVGKAHLSGKVEADFGGFSTNNFLVRLRQAYVKFAWDNHHQFLIGQTWHPMAIDAQPEELSMAAGAPFNPLNRSPQLQYTFSYNGFFAEGAALWQLQYTSPGPDGNSLNYAFNNHIPELLVSLGYNKNGLKLGATAEYLSLRPRLKGERATIVNNIDTILPCNVDERVHSISASAYITYAYGDFSIKAKTIYGENTGHLNMLGGYGATKENADGSREYAPIRISSSWIDLIYGKKYKFGLFLGYFKNLGAKNDLLNSSLIYERDSKNINQFFRILPYFSFNIKSLNVGIEYEANAVNYGDLQKDGSVKGTHYVWGHRVCAVIKYNF